MTLLLSVDPSISSSGAALYRDGRLRACARVTPPPGSRGLPIGARWLLMSELIWGWVLGAAGTGCVNAVAYERPQIYDRSKSEGDPNDLPGLAAIGAGVVAIASSYWRHLELESPGPNEADATVEEALAVHTPTPREWTSGTRKVKRGDPWRCSRGDRIRANLTPEERVLVPAQHDVMDAVAIGLHVLGRFKPHRVYTSG